MQAIADPVDAILLREVEAAPTVSGPVAVLDDQSGALTLGLHDLLADVPLHVACDALSEEEAVAATTSGLARIHLVPGLGPELLDGVQLVVLRLPKSLAALDETAEAVARWADPSVVLLAGGRLKHMSRGMNDVLARHFGAVRASLGAQKSRVLMAREPVRPAGTRYPLAASDAELSLAVRAHGAAFAGAAVDLGTRFLLGFAGAFPTDARRVVDLGCGTGLLAVGAARALPEATVLAVDESSGAVASAAATAQANGVANRVEVRRSDLLRGVEDRSVDLILCNPPFHRGNARDSAPAFAMIEEAARTLAPGGELWTVYNTHLPYLRALRRLVGRTSVVGQNPHYTVTRSVQDAG